MDDRARLADAVQACPTAIMCVSSERGCYELVNQAFADMVGRPLAEVWASDPYAIWVEVTHPDDIKPERDAIERMSHGEIDRYRIEKRIVARGREPRWQRVDVVAERGSDGRLQTLTAFFTDIHEERAAVAGRERLEAQLQRAQKLDALGKLAGGVAHDFNNRLLIIIGYTELLRQQLPDGSPQAEQADLVLDSAQRGAELTRQLLAYSRRQVLKPESFDVNQTVGGMRQLLERLMGDRIQLITALQAVNAVYSDPGQVEQVILNLAINARDAMPQGGRLTLETRDVSLRAGQDPALPAGGDYVMLDVADTGVGIPDDVVPHIFEPFFTTKEVGRGTGLGLSMVEGIVQQSGGTVKVATRSGEGTRFSVCLPRATGVPMPRYTSSSAPRHAVDFETVLVCDDDDGVRKLLADVLGLRAYKILQACNGRDALEVAERHGGPIHLLVTDLVMPVLGGIELAIEMRRRHPALPVLFVSGYTEDADLLSVPLGPATRFLAKPFVPGDLTREVFAMLEERPVAD